MAIEVLEPDTPPSSGDLEEYIYREFLRIADSLNSNFQEIATRLDDIENRLTNLEP